MGTLNNLLAAEEMVPVSIKGVDMTERTEGVSGHRQASEWEAELSLQEGLKGEIAEAVVWVLAMVQGQGLASQRRHNGWEEGGFCREDLRVFEHF